MRRRIQVRYGVGVLQYTGYSGNISSNGLMLRALRVFEPGTVLELEVLIDEKSYRVKGKVRWAREGDVRLLQTGRVGMGIKFVAPPAEFLEAVKAMDVAAPSAGVSS